MGVLIWGGKYIWLFGNFKTRHGRKDMGTQKSRARFPTTHTRALLENINLSP